jgi:hypothetical protein
MCRGLVGFGRCERRKRVVRVWLSWYPDLPESITRGFEIFYYKRYITSEQINGQLILVVDHQGEE